MLKGINIGTDTTVKDILDILEGVDPTARSEERRVGKECAA